MHPKHARISRRLKNTAKVHTVNGTFCVENFLLYNIFPKSKFVSKSEFYIFNFNDFFDGLLGYEFLQKSKAVIDAANNTLNFPDLTIPMKKKFPNTIILNACETKVFRFPVDAQNGDFLIPDDVEVHSSVFMHGGIYRVNDKFAYVPISNESKENIAIEFPKLNAEINNFEIANAEQEPVINKKLFDNLRLSHLNAEERKAILKIIANNQNAFYLDDTKLSCTNIDEHRIVTKDDIPVHVENYRYPFCHKEEVQKQIQKMLSEEIIKPSNSPWSSPIWIVPKKPDASGRQKWRLVIDYRKLNEKTIDDRYPIPHVTETLDKLGKAIYFTTLDLTSGFYQIPLHVNDRKKTAFTVENGHYEFLRMPMGLKGAPATFQRVMDNVLREFIGKSCMVYLDDVLVFSSSLQEHTETLEKILKTLNKFNFKIQLDKSEFLRKETSWLGHVITPEGVKPNPDKILAIKKWALPRTDKELRGFLGILGYYRKFIGRLSEITKPLTQCLRKGEKLTHSKEFIEAFEKCKTILTSSHVLQYPDFSKPFILTTDASNYSLGAVLSQGPIGKDKPVAYASRTLSKTEENYSTIEKELLAIVWACKYFRPYLFGNKFTLFTDHQPLIYIFNMKDPSTKLVRWRLYLGEFDFEIKYRKGSQNVVADGLSRIRIDNDLNASESSVENASLAQNIGDVSDDVTAHSADTDDSHFIPMTTNAINSYSNQIFLNFNDSIESNVDQIFPKVIRTSIKRPSFSKADILKIFKDHLDYKKINCIACPEPLIPTLQSVYRDYFCRNQALKVVISQKILQDVKTPEEENELIEKIHDRAHRGIQENLEVLKRKFFFPRMKSKVSKFIHLCSTCKAAKYDRKPYKITLAEVPIPKKPFEIIHVDLFISSPNTFLSAVDKFSRFGILIPIKSKSIPDVRGALTRLFATYKQPEMIVSDNEPALKSIEIRGLLEDLNIKTYYTPSNRSESNGIVERFHSTIAEIFRCIKSRHQNLSPKELFNLAVSHYNATIHSAHNMKPIEVFYAQRDGQLLPLDLAEMMKMKEKLYDEVVLQLEKKHKKDHENHNKSRESGPTLKENDVVYVERQGIRNKTKPAFEPVTVLEDREKTFIDSKGRKLHKENLKRI